MTAPAEALKLAREIAARNWTEDAPHENGKYQCTCVFCKETFIGHKRRVVCKVCAAKPDEATGEKEL